MSNSFTTFFLLHQLCFLVEISFDLLYYILMIYLANFNDYFTKAYRSKAAILHIVAYRVSLLISFLYLYLFNIINNNTHLIK